jgi:hypothetical protein
MVMPKTELAGCLANSQKKPARKTPATRSHGINEFRNIDIGSHPTPRPSGRFRDSTIKKMTIEAMKISAPTSTVRRPARQLLRIAKEHLQQTRRIAA